MPKDIYAKIPDNVQLSARAARDLKSIRKKNSQEAKRVVDDIVGLANRSLPPAKSQKLSGMEGLWELDSGRYRVVYLWQEKILFIATIFPKSDQSKVFRHL